jgi:circadian clock protein KaiC
VRPSLLGLEVLLAAMQKLVCDFNPAMVVLDPISDLIGVGTAHEVSAMLTRQVAFPRRATARTTAC